MGACSLSLPALATHIIGGEIGYTHVSGFVYEITLSIYGDCAGAAFPSLPAALPRVEITKNGVPFSFIDLSLTAPGIEVTPVCPSEVNNTTCVNTSGTIPGIMRFIFKGTVVLDGPASNWSFIFNSQFGGSSGAGRSFAITNITNGSRMALEATLNNTSGPNNSSIFTTIPTPFFCLNLPQEFNQGAVDIDGDQLTFSLVPGLEVDNTGTIIGTVSYIAPYTFLNPLATVPGSFNFNTTNGQMSFTPNLLQTSLVVNKVVETRSGVVVGSCMREMNLVVLNNCTNQSPEASIPTSTIGTFDSSRTITICNANLNPVFVIEASDPDNQNVLVTVTGLPPLASYTVTANGTAHPIITIHWNIPQPTVPGTYSFYVNCADDGCPLTSKQTFAYTVNLVQPFTPLVFNISNETCTPGMDGAIEVITSSTFGGVIYSLNGGGYQGSANFNGLVAGTYTITVKDNQGCTFVTSTIVTSTILPTLSYFTESESCFPGNDGSIIINASSSNGSIIGYSINGSSLQGSNIFSNLSSGSYTISAKDIIGCEGKVIVNLNPSPFPQIDEIGATRISCFGEGDGMIKLKVSNAGTNYSFLLIPGSIINTTGIFQNLQKGNYTVIVSSDKQCKDTAYATIIEPDQFVITNIDIQKATCDRNNGALTVSTNYQQDSSGQPILIYTLWPATFINTIGVFNDITPGNYTVSVRDSNFCIVDSPVYIGAQPNLMTSTIVHEDLKCNGWGTEGEAEVFVSGGVEPYSYLWTTDPPSSSQKISNLYYGWYFVDIIDATGCAMKDTVYIVPGPCCENVYIPNAFTPNGDGHNDEWKLVSSTGLSIDQFAVYNRWGDMIWHTRDQHDSWNGKRNGIDIEVGTYFYILRYQCLSDGKHYQRKGDVTILH
jgi:gliding motility-associated-like protein